MKILLFGSMGQLGWELQSRLSTLGHLLSFCRQDANFEHPERLKDIVQKYQPHVIVNAAAYTTVDKSESEPHVAEKVNAEAVNILADESKKQNSLFVHYSTDYVFDGSKKGAYVESDSTNPINVYGRTKAQGERGLQESGCRYFLFRTSWVYAMVGSNFIKTVLSWSHDKNTPKQKKKNCFGSVWCTNGGQFDCKRYNICFIVMSFIYIESPIR